MGPPAGGRLSGQAGAGVGAMGKHTPPEFSGLPGTAKVSWASRSRARPQAAQGSRGHPLTPIPPWRPVPSCEICFPIFVSYNLHAVKQAGLKCTV